LFDQHTVLLYRLMNSFCRYLLIIIGLAILGYLLWYFSNVLAYILVAAVLSLIGRPLVGLLGEIRMGNSRLPDGLSAMLVLVLIWLVVFGFFRLFVPLIANEANELSQIDPQLLMQRLEKPLNKVETWYYELNAGQDDVPRLENMINERIKSVLNISVITNFFSSLLGLLGNVFIAIFSISFITFFFLKEKSIITDFIVLLIPQKHEQAVRKAMTSTRRMLRRYFIGLLAQAMGILLLATLGMLIVGIDFPLAITIGLVMAVINVIPYLGPYLGGAIGILLGVANNLDMNFSAELLPMVLSMLTVVVVVQLVDNFLYQPLIFGTSVKAHPLEIFLVIIMAGTLAGIPGMILGIPTYTVIRVFAKEFLSRVRVVKKLTRNI
jgi:predicted PurR-regulated permease PerM